MQTTHTTQRVPRRYLPSHLTRKDKIRQSRELRASRRLYTRGVYHRRPIISSFHSRKSPHIRRAVRRYGVPAMGATDALAKATQCSKDALARIIRKGEGAYYSSGSRPNQTAHSWGLARLASAITAGKAAAVDFSILQEGCTPRSPAYILAKKARAKYGNGTRSVPKVRLSKGN